jgi:hypothetical protein
LIMLNAAPEGWHVTEWDDDGWPCRFGRDACPFTVKTGMLGHHGPLRWIIHTTRGKPLRNARGGVRHYCSPAAAAFRAETEMLNRPLEGSRFGRCLLGRAQEPPVAFPSGSRQHSFCGLQFVLGLLFLQQINIETPFFYVVDNGSPCQNDTSNVAQPRQRAMIGG